MRTDFYHQSDAEIAAEARTLLPWLLAALEEAEAEVAALNERLAEHQKANDQVVGQNVELTAEVAALKKGVASLMESRKKWKRRALHCGNALDREEWAGVDLDVLPPPLSDADRGAILARIRAERLATEAARIELAEDRADYFASLDGGRKEGES